MKAGADPKTRLNEIFATLQIKSTTTESWVNGFEVKQYIQKNNKWIEINTSSDLALKSCITLKCCKNDKI